MNLRCLCENVKMGQKQIFCIQECMLFVDSNKSLVTFIQKPVTCGIPGCVA